MPAASKEAMLQEITNEFEKSPYAFISSFDNFPVADMAALRRSLEKSSRRSMVVKQALVKKIFTDKKFNDADKLLKGSILITFGDKDPQVISKAIVDFSKKNDKFSPEGVIFENSVYDQSFVKQLATLPSRHELLTQVVIRIKSPISGLVMTLGQVMRGVVVALNAIREKKAGQAQTA